MKYHHPQKIQIIGHRGSAEPYPENTIEAILYGILSRAGMIEIDLRLSKDNEVILSHDQNLYRMTGVNQEVRDYTWKDLSKLQIRKNKKKFHLSRLEDVFKIVPRDIQFYLELKSIDSSHLHDQDTKLADEVVTIIKKDRIKTRCLIMSVDTYLIEYVKNKYPSFSTGIIVKSTSMLNAVLKDTKSKWDCLAVKYTLLTKSKVKMVQDSGIPFIVWTVNSKRLWEKIASYKPAGIVTDFPEKFTS